MHVGYKLTKCNRRACAKEEAQVVCQILTLIVNTVQFSSNSKTNFYCFFFVHYPTEIFEYPHEMEYRVVVA